MIVTVTRVHRDYLKVCQRLAIDLLDPPESINLTVGFGDEWDDGYSVRLRDWDVVAIWGDE